MNRLLVLGFLFMISFIGLTGCQDRERHNRAFRLATRRLVDAYADAAKRVVSDCGPDGMATSNYPDCFFYNPGWKKWKGPYLVGKPRVRDYFDTPIQFSVQTNELWINSAGQDRVFGTDDDITSSVKLR